MNSYWPGHLPALPRSRPRKPAAVEVNGQPVAKFRIASTPRFYDKQAGEWKDGESLFLTCNVWRQAAENVAESMTRGS